MCTALLLLLLPMMRVDVDGIVILIIVISIALVADKGRDDLARRSLKLLVVVVHEAAHQLALAATLIGSAVVLLLPEEMVVGVAADVAAGVRAITLGRLRQREPLLLLLVLARRRGWRSVEDV